MSEFNESIIVGAAPESLEDFTWLKPYILESYGKNAASIESVTTSGAGGLTSEMKRLKVTCDDSSEFTVVCKAPREDFHPRSAALGLPREAFFYHFLAPTLSAAGVSLPRVVYAHGDMKSGVKVLVLEDLSVDSLQSGYLFGPGSVLNWGKDLDNLIRTSNVNNVEYSMRDASMSCFLEAARLHAAYWQDRSLLKYDWLRATNWIEGQGRDAWETSQKFVLDYWTATKAKIEAGTSTVKWSDRVIECMDASFAKVNWEAYQADLKTRKWTLTHGDFHPANIMWRWAKDGKPSHPVILDWEVVGVGSGPQDLSQFLISHAAPAERRLHEDALVREYYACLTGAGKYSEDASKKVDAATYSWEECWHDYIHGGIERWVWLFAYLTGLCPDNMNQYFHDQLDAFMKDHNITAENIGLPRA